MAKRIASKEEVEIYLDTVMELLADRDRVSINNEIWLGRRNKTREFISETGLSVNDIKGIVRELAVENYSYTTDDRNQNFLNEEFWIFGMKKNIVDVEEDLYIKLKTRELNGQRLLIMSFHREEPSSVEEKLRFPYL